ncbi:MAG: protein kinase [Planctomycetota bacterium]
MQLLPPGSDSRWPALGDQIGPWVLARDYKLEGSGEMFVARRADGAFQREVLITFLRPDASRPNARQIFEAEVELQAKLDHPGIAKVFGAGNTEGGVPYLVTEYLPGEDIEVHCDREQAPFVERIRLFRLVCEALQHAHDRGIVGINLQANNVHLMPDGSVRPVVYGLAQSNGNSQPRRIGRSTRATMRAPSNGAANGRTRRATSTRSACCCTCCWRGSCPTTTVA